MAFHKRLLRHPALRAAACFLVAQYIRLVHWTGRWTVEGIEHPRGLINQSRPGIVGFWHGRLLMLPRAWMFPPAFKMLISSHQDGQLIARTVAHHGIETVAGSSSRGGGAAFRKMIRALKAGDWVGITPDGPRGPRMRASAGVISLARLSGAPILPLVYSTARGPFLRSWDRFLLAAPFSSGIIIWGEPISVAPDADDRQMEAARRQLEETLNRMLADADNRLRADTVQPAERKQP